MKNFFLFSIILSINTLNCYSQNWQWGRSIEGSTYGSSVSADTKGNVFVTGGFQSPTLVLGSITLINAGGGNGYANDIFIAKYKANGNVLWAKRVGGTGSDEGYAVSADASGNVFVTGWFKSPSITFGSTTLINTGDCNIFIAKYDSLGNVIWAKSVAGKFDRGFSLSADPSGNIFLSGTIMGKVSTFDTITLPNGYASNFFIAKYDANGNALWAKSVGVEDESYCEAVSSDAKGNVFVTGFYNRKTLSFGLTKLYNSDSTGLHSDIFIAKYGSDGSLIWAKNVGGTNYDAAYSISTDPSGDAFITGVFQSNSLVFGSTTLNGGGLFVAKYDANGNALWAKSAKGFGKAVSGDHFGNVYATGTFTSPSITFGSDTLFSPVGSLDLMYIVKYDAIGNVLCASLLPSGGNYLHSISTDLVGNAYTSGVFQINPFIVGIDTLNHIGPQNIFVAKYNCENNTPTGVDELTNKESVTIFPNPSAGIYTVSLKNNAVETRISIYDVFGNCLWKKNV
jgi:hypothetical protein